MNEEEYSFCIWIAFKKRELYLDTKGVDNETRETLTNELNQEILDKLYKINGVRIGLDKAISFGMKQISKAIKNTHRINRLINQK